MKPISPLRFDAIAGYAREPQSLFFAEEIGWYEHSNERVLGLLIRDRTDSDYGGLIFGRDQRLRFRCVDVTGFDSRRRHAEVNLRRRMESAAAQSDAQFHQGDETGSPIDFFTSVVSDERLNKSFVSLRNEEVFSAARGIVEPMMRWYDDVDGNFIEQFQTSGFDARIWELYLFAAFREMGYGLDRVHKAPDFICVNPFVNFGVEATTVNPTRDAKGNVVASPPTDTPDEIQAFLTNYMPIKFGSALTSKLAKRYWQQSHMTGLPLVFAVQDFSAPQSMTWTRSAFEKYIYGYAHDWQRDAKGRLIIRPRKIVSHRWGSKEIPSGFFDLPDTENISAVIFSNSGTISKFNRMGVLAGFGSDRLRLTRVGTAISHDPNASEPLRFIRRVNDPEYHETWREGLSIWHNPRAKLPLPPEFFPGIAHHRLLPDGLVQSMVPEWYPLGSFTIQTLEDKSSSGSPG
ncbi:hypothetical protein [Bradyrhizobium ganzhouense]|uniref:hypothetical protein n=1 Tax=Bradyrhizobium ganzhouense TaxID=1179767 RepID=UPI003CE7E4DD